MLLSIDRVLQLISEGKTIEKIAELAECESSDVVNLIEEARVLLSKYEKTFSKRKIILKKKKPDDNDIQSIPDQNRIKEILNGAELSAIPVKTSLTMNVGAKSSGNPGYAGIGIIIYDNEDRQIGKVSEFIGTRNVTATEHAAFIKAFKLAIYFQVNELKIRTDSESVVRQLTPGYKTKDTEILKFINESNILIEKIKKFKIEYLVKSSNDKAIYLAGKAIEKIQEKHK